MTLYVAVLEAVIFLVYNIYTVVTDIAVTVGGRIMSTLLSPCGVGALTRPLRPVYLALLLY